MKILRKVCCVTCSERGQSLVEMSLMMVMLLVIMSAVLDLGRGFFSYIAIQNAAGEGALYASINPRCPHAVSVSSVSSCTDPNNVDYRAKHESDGATERRLVDPSKMDVSVVYADGSSNYNGANIVEGDPVTVIVTYHFRIIGPFSVIAPDGDVIFTARAVQNILDLKKNGSIAP